MRRTAVLAAVALLSAGLPLGGCGFIAAGKVSDTKPNGFVLRGYVSTPVPAGDTRNEGDACAAPLSLPDIAGGTGVRVLDPAGTMIASGTLAGGAIARTDAGTTCDFVFEIHGVPGGVTTYSLVVGTQAPRGFTASELRQGKPAVIVLTG